MTQFGSRPRTAFTILVLGSLVALAGPACAHDDPANDGLIDGGGSAKTDCISKFQTGLELNYPPPPKKKQRELACTDGDLACDADGAVNGSCSVNVGLCLADDGDMPECTPASIAPGAVVVKNKPVGHRKHDPELAALQSSVDALLGTGGVACDNPGAGGGSCFQCTAAPSPVTAAVSVRKGRKKVKVKAVTEPAGAKNKPIKDKDKLKLRCLECGSESTFEHLAKIVFKANCTTSSVCHTGPGPAAGLNLDTDSVGLAGLYAELIAEAPTSPGPAAWGMTQRIVPGDPDLDSSVSSSLVYEKLRKTNSELDQICTDNGQPAGCLGTHMPPGADGFSTGKLELLKNWIAAGAPFDGWVAGSTCGEPADIWNPAQPLDPPPPGQGFQVHMPAPEGFVLQPGTEFEGCQWIRIPDSVTETTYVTSVDLRANSGTHHIILWEDQPDSGPAAEPTAFDADDSLCANDFGLKSFRIGAQDADFVQSLPDNVSFTIEPGKVFGFNVHYTNPFNVPIQPEVWVNFNGTATPTAREAADIFPGDLSFSVPPGTIGTGNLVSYEYPWSWPGCFFFLTSHMHRRGTEFKAWTSKPSSWSDTTDLIYDSTDWDHPVVLDPWPRLMLSQGDKLWFQCQFDNGVFADVTRRCRPLGASACGLFNDYVCVTDADCGAGTTGVCEDCPLDFGFLSEDEMCFMPGLYYPATYGTPTCPW